MRENDPRIGGRFWSVDPLARKYPELSPYQFASNNPILGIDRDGLEFYNSNSSRISIGLTFDPKLKQITYLSTYYRRENLPDALNDAIDNANTCSNCLGSTAARVGSFSFQPPFSKTASDVELTDMDLDKTSVGASSYGTSIIPKNKKEATAQERSREYFTEGVSPAIGKANLVLAALDVATSLLQKVGNENLKSIIRTAENQSVNGAAAVFVILQDAINSGKLDGHLDQGSLTGVANYLLYGAEINKTEVINGQATLVQDVELTKTAKKLWEDYSAAAREKKMKEEQNRDQRSKVDDVGGKQ